MNQMQSPPYGRAENAHNGLKSGSAGKICAIVKIFFKGGRKTKQYYEHKQQQPILPTFSLAALMITISASDYIQNLSRII